MLLIRTFGRESVGRGMDIDLCIEMVRSYLAGHKINRFAAARAAGLSVNALQNMRKPEWNPRASTLRAVIATIPNKYRDEFAKWVARRSIDPAGPIRRGPSETERGSSQT